MVPPPGARHRHQPGHDATPRHEGAGVRWRAGGARLGDLLKSSPLIVRWLVLGALVGASAGLVVVAFVHAIAFADQVLLRDLSGYRAPTTAASGDHPGSLTVPRRWVLPLLVGAGGVVAGLVALVVPEVTGSGTDVALTAVHENPRALRLRSIPAKIVASAATIGSGGSGGPEGPSAQVAGAVGSWLTRLLDLPPTEGRVAVAIGIGAGIGSVFRAPLGGALLSAEILYRQDADFSMFIPSAIASTIGYTVYGAFDGFGPLMGLHAQSYVFRHPLNLLWFVVVGVVAAAFGLLYILAMRWARLGARRFGHGRWAVVARPAIGGLAAGAVAVAIPGVLGSGDGWTQRALGADLLLLPLWFVLAMPLAKLVATALTVGSGGSGGLFSPGMAVGAFSGAACWRLLHPVAPGLGHDPAPFVIVGMMCCLGSAARVPLSMTVMAAEMTGSIGVVAPALLAVGLATLIVRHYDVSLIDAQPRSADDTPARRLVSGLPLLETMAVGEVMHRPNVVLDAAVPADDALAVLRHHDVPGAPVVDERGLFVGVVDADRLAEMPPEERSAPVGRVADRQAATVAPELRASVAATALATAERDWTPVLDARRHVVGVLSSGDLVRGYRDVLLSSLRRIAGVHAAGTGQDPGDVLDPADGPTASGRGARGVGGRGPWGPSAGSRGVRGRRPRARGSADRSTVDRGTTDRRAAGRGTADHAGGHGRGGRGTGGPGATTFDGVVGEGSPLIGVDLAHAPLPPGTVVVAVTRGTEIFVPTGTSVLAAGDGLSILVPRDRRDAVADLLAVPRRSEGDDPSPPGAPAT
jgi:H+/Cl- antiporter ClcA/predicted transcriptional regulator